MSEALRLAVLGLGSAGRSRQRACEETEGVELAATISRREEVGDQTLESVLADPKIDALAISTENPSHAHFVRRSLEAGKHVLCDYPLALSGAEARTLFALARRQGRVLHVEHIALLSEEHRQLKAEAAATGHLVKGEFLFQGGWNAKLADRRYSGPYPFLAASRLVALTDLFGPFRVTKARQDIQDGAYSLHLHLHFAKGGILEFTEERREGLPRRRGLTAQCDRGILTLKTGAMGGGLFARDLAWFRARVREGRACYYNEDLMVTVLDQLAAL